MSALDRLIPGQHILDPTMRAPHEAADVTQMLDTALIQGCPATVPRHLWAIRRTHGRLWPLSLSGEN